jgi:hypothetical protein
MDIMRRMVPQPFQHLESMQIWHTQVQQNQG